MTAEIIEFRPRKIVETPEEEDSSGPQRCDDCVHFLSGVGGFYCRAYNEDLVSVHQGDGCPEFVSP